MMNDFVAEDDDEMIYNSRTFYWFNVILIFLGILYCFIKAVSSTSLAK